MTSAWEEVDDRDFLLDDAALWAAIDSATTSKPIPTLKRPQPTTYTTSVTAVTSPPPPVKPIISSSSHAHNNNNIININNNNTTPSPPPSKVARWSHLSSSESESHFPIVPFHSKSSSPLSVSSHHHQSNRSCTTTTNTNTDTAPPPPRDSSTTLCYTGNRVHKEDEREQKMTTMTHSLSGLFPSVSLFKEYQSAALAILEKSDYILISGSPFIKKTGWRKISCYFDISYEIKDKTIEFDGDRNVQRAEFVVRAYMHGGRFSDGWGSCDRREKRFMKPNNDIPSTAETRAKNKACQDLLGIGGPGVNRVK